jgi:hypothetical protein
MSNGRTKSAGCVGEGSFLTMFSKVKKSQRDKRSSLFFPQSMKEKGFITLPQAEVFTIYAFFVTLS